MRRKHSSACARAAQHAPGSYVYDEVEAACKSGQYSCRAVLMPSGHIIEDQVYCNNAPLEMMLYGISKSNMNQPLVHFNKSLCSICGVEQISDEM
jgi:hypothetical protein